MEHLKETHLIIRVDASTQMGTGHLMRCLSLAQAWKDAGGRVVFITACQNEGLFQRLQEEELDIHLLARSYPDASDWDYTKNLLATYPNAWVVLDGYHFDEAYQQRVKEAGYPMLVIDDMALLKHYYADIVLNQNLHAEQLQYSCEPYTCLLLGTRYVLLRREFLAWRGWKREIPEVARRVLVTLGGSDPENHTLRVIRAIQQVDVPALEATVVIGASNPSTDVLEAEVKQSRVPMHLIYDAQDMLELIAWADVAVSSAGTTIWELLFLGTPILALVWADNQQWVAEQLEQQQLGKNLGWVANIQDELLAETISLLMKDVRLRVKMSNNARQIVDGRGGRRVINFMQEIRSHRLRLRPATLEDCRLLWEWANDPVARRASFSLECISWEDHIRWFRTKLSDQSCYFYVLLSEEDAPIGQMRFDTSSNEAEINVSVAPNYRSRGYGARGIRIASKCLFQETDITRIYAHIKPDNDASIRAFTEAGYRVSGIKAVKGHKAMQMVLNKDREVFEDGSHQDW